jgi:hypothetical protein
MEEAIFPVVITAALLATTTWSVPLVWALAVGNLLFVARIGGSAGGDSRLATVLGWSGLAVACALALWGYAPRGAALSLRQRFRQPAPRSFPR